MNFSTKICTFTKQVTPRRTGYATAHRIEIYVINETSTDVCPDGSGDNLRLTSTPSPVVQETHYDPWGLELTGIGYQQGGIKGNRYLYNGKEQLDDTGLQAYDYGARMYDATIGRWNHIDPYSEAYFDHSPFNYALNNPIRFIDEDGNYVVVAGRNSKNNLFVTAHRTKLNQAKTQDQMANLPVIGLGGYAVKALYAGIDPSYTMSAADHVFAGLGVTGMGLVRMIQPFSSLAARIVEVGWEGVGQIGSRAVENEYSELFLDELTFEVFENSGIAVQGIGPADRSITFNDEYVSGIRDYIKSTNKEGLKGRRLDNAVGKEIENRMNTVKERIRGLSQHFDLSTSSGQADFRFVLNALFNEEEDNENE